MFTTHIDIIFNQNIYHTYDIYLIKRYLLINYNKYNAFKDQLDLSLM